MADIFYESSIGKNPVIPYSALAERMFPIESKQKLIPFLGAGASSPLRSSVSQHGPTIPSQDKIDSVSDQLGLNNRRSRLFIALAMQLASCIEAEEDSSGAVSDAQTAFRQAKDSHFPPSAYELADVLAKLSSYDTFERPLRKLRTLLTANDADLIQMLRWVAVLTEITQSTAPLLYVSSYYEYTNKREDLWEKLHLMFAEKRWPTATNFLVARAAHWHLRPERHSRKNYLIITTNYDRLMEISLDAFNVPYCVLTVDRADRHVDVRFSGIVQKYLKFNDQDYREFHDELNGTRFPANFTLEMSRPLVLLYKIHGCLFPVRQGGDSIVLSDEDYIDYLCRLSDNAGMIPGVVAELMEGKGFLFAGYSFSDWNVRGIYKKIVEKRGGGNSGRAINNLILGRTSPVQDYAIVRNLNMYESAFFRQKDISLLDTELYQFSHRVRREARKWTASNPK